MLGHDETIYKQLKLLSGAKCGSPENLVFYPRYCNPFGVKDHKTFFDKKAESYLLNHKALE